jgi:biopolymer transport protein ExbB
MFTFATEFANSQLHQQKKVQPEKVIIKIFFSVMKQLMALVAFIGFMTFAQTTRAQDTTPKDTIETVATDTVAADTVAATAFDDMAAESELDVAEGSGLHYQLKTKFIDGSPLFMSLVALALVFGLAFCIERISYLTLSEINAKKLMRDIDAKVSQGDIEGAKQLCRDTRGPVASICYQGLMHINEKMDDIERSIYSYGSVQTAKLEKGTSWIKLFIAMAPSLGFLGTVIGMVMAFEQIQTAGDIGPTIVASGMKVALITTIFGIVVALILQLFYSYITSKIEHLTSQMEESVVTLLDIIMKHKAQ